MFMERKLQGRYIMIVTVLLTAVLAGTPSAIQGPVPQRCTPLQAISYVAEWKQAQKIVGWEGKLDKPDKVVYCPFMALDIEAQKRMYGKTEWYTCLTKRGKMCMIEVVTTFVPEAGKGLTLTLRHEFIHVLLARLRHVKDERGFVGDEEEYICRVLPEDCAWAEEN